MAFPFPKFFRRADPAPHVRSIDAAGRQRRGKGQGTFGPVNSEIAAAGPIVRSRSRSLYVNNGLIRNALDNLVTSMTGTGIRPNVADEEVMRRFESWTTAADYDGRTDFYGLQRILALHMVRDGEGLAILHVGDDGELWIQVLPPEHLDESKTAFIASHHEIVNGVEFIGGKIVAYWILPQRPTAEFTEYAPSVRFDAADVIHVFEAQSAGQVRGLSRVAPAVIAANELDQLTDAHLVGATRRSTTPIIRSHTPANDDPAVIRDRMADALHVRMAGGTPAPEVRQFMSMSLMDVAKDSLGRAGISTRGMSNDEVLTRAGEHTTSDFALVVSNAANKTAMASYQAAQSPLKQLGRQRSLSNFKTSTAIRLGEMGRLEELAESGEITHTSRAENGESLVLKTYARAITVSRNLIINDDLNLLGDMTAAFGEAAADTERDIMTDLITGNPNLSDGNPVFSTARGNTIASGVSLGSTGDTAALDDARKAMRGFKGLDGKTLINVTPRYLLVGPAGEAAAERFLASIYPATSADAQSGMAKLTLLVEPRIEDESWYIFADPARVAALQYGYLSSAQGVQIQRAEAWDTLGLKFRAWLDFGAGWLDWRAAYLNPGD